MSSGATIAARIATSLAGIVIARAVGPGMFGVYAALWAVMELCNSHTEIGMITGLKRAAAREPHAMPRLLGNVFLARALLGLAFLSAAFFLLPLLSTHPQAVRMFLPLGLASFSIICSEPILAILQVRGEQLKASLFIALRGLAMLGGVLCLAFLDPVMMTIAWFQGVLYCTALALLILREFPMLRPRLALGELAGQIKESLVFGVASLLRASMWNVPILLLSHFGTEEQVGYFAVALRFVSIVILAGAAANNEVFLPSLFGLYTTNKAKFSALCAHMQRLYFALGIIASATLYACSEPLIVLIQGSEYAPAIPVLRITTWTVACTFAAIAANASLTAGDKMGKKLLCLTLATGVTLLACALLIPLHGLIGACHGKVIGDVMLTVLLLVTARLINIYPFSGLMALLPSSLLTVAASVACVAAMPQHYVIMLSAFFFCTALAWSPLLLVWRRRGETLRAKS